MPRNPAIAGRSVFVEQPDFDLVPLDLDMPPCPDVYRRSQLRHADMDARLWFGKFNEHGILEDHTTGRYRSLGAITKLHTQLKSELAWTKMREVGGLDWFSYGLDAVPSFAAGESQLTSSYIPLVPGPATRQQYWAEYFATSAKSFESYHHDPLAHRAVELMREFTIGKGIEATFKSAAAEKAWESFWRENKMDDRIHDIVGDLSVYGELFLRYFPLRGTLVIRSLDPATIYEIVSDQEDNETVYFYHQQYQTRTELYAPPAGARGAPQGPTPRAVTKFVIRQIDAKEIDHVKVNSRSSEVRGRPDLFPALGYLKRLRDLMTSQVIKEEMQARMAYDLTVKGNDGDLRAMVASMFPGNRPPPPGSILAHTEAATLDGVQFNQSADSSLQFTIDTLLNLCALGLGVPKEYLGVSGRGTRATALVATEPGVRRFEDRQGVVERTLHRMADRVFDAAGLNGDDDRHIEFTFPSIATEDRQAKLKDLAFAEGMGWVAKKTVAQTAAKELGNTTFDFDEEQKAIADEFKQARDDVPDNDPDTGLPKPDDKRPQGDGKIRRPMILTQFRQEPKLDPTKPPGDAEDQPPGLLVPGAGAGAVGPDGKPIAPPSNGNGAATTRSGFPADENPATGAGAANIRRDEKGIKESEGEQLTLVDLVEAAVTAGVREGKAPRRRPDDPDFQQRAAEYRQRTREHADELISAAHPNGREDGDGDDREREGEQGEPAS